MQRPSAPAGFTAIEMLVALIISAIAMTVLARVAGTERQVLGAVSDRTDGRAELDVAAGGLPLDLRALGDPLDLRASEARDSAVEFRQTISSAIVCDTLAGMTRFAPADDDPRFGGSLRQPEAGDTAWVLDSTLAWRPMAIASVSSASGSACGAGGPVLTAAALVESRTAVRLAGGAVVPPGSVVRVTRPFRYSFYRSSDHAWYLGARDWNTTTARFNTIQPVAGPFLQPAEGGVGLTYMDSTGAALPTPLSDARRVVAVKLTLLAAARRVLAPHATGASVDTATVVVRIRRPGSP